MRLASKSTPRGPINRCPWLTLSRPGFPHPFESARPARRLSAARTVSVADVLVAA